MKQRTHRRAAAVARRLGGGMLAVVALAACGGSAPPPEPGVSRSIAPDLRGRRVLLLPVQQNAGVLGDVDAELAFTLTGRGREIDWVLPAEIDEALARAPAVQARSRGLPVSRFLLAEVERVGDPLYGQLRRMASLVEAEVILLPVRTSFEVNESRPGSTPRVRLAAVVIDARTGRVLWFGIEEGGDFPQSDPRALASGVENLARTLLWYARG